MEMVYWADLLHPKPLDPSIKEEDNPLRITEPYVPKAFEKVEPSKFRKKVLDYVEKQLDKLFTSDSTSIDMSAISDLIIKKYFKELEIYYSENLSDESGKQKPAKTLIQKRLEDVLRKHKGKEILLLSHSMGTIIAYDVLTKPNKRINVDTLITFGSPLGIPIILEKIAVAKQTSLKLTRKMKSPEKITSEWLNFSDLNDKVALNYNLSDDYEPNSHGIKPQDYLVHNDYIGGEGENPHKSYGYLRTPEIAQVVYDFLARDKRRLSIWFNSKAATLLDKIF